MNSSNLVSSFNIGAPGNLDSSLFGLNQSSSETVRPTVNSNQKSLKEKDFSIKKMKSTQENGLNVSGETEQ